MERYEIKRIPKDFQVQEIINFPIAPESPNYFYYVMDKCGFTTFEAVEQIARYFDIPSHFVHYSGLKDEDAITTQFISTSFQLPEKLLSDFNRESFNQPTFVTINYFGRGEQSLKIAKLQGNCFRVNVRNLPLETAQQIYEKKTHTLFFINYYGSQRFGLPNQIKNTHLIGKALKERDYVTAHYHITKQNSDLAYQARQPNVDAEYFFNCLDRRYLAFFRSAYYSHLWNENIKNCLDRLNLPLVEINLEGITVHVCANENDNLIFLQKFPNMTNTRVIADSNEFKNVRYQKNTVVQTQFHAEKILVDDINPNKYACELSFYLTSGCYATVAIAQFMHNFQLHPKEKVSHVKLQATA